jgi:hypothetical protein
MIHKKTSRATNVTERNKRCHGQDYQGKEYQGKYTTEYQGKNQVGYFRQARKSNIGRINNIKVRIS